MKDWACLIGRRRGVCDARGGVTRAQRAQEARAARVPSAPERRMRAGERPSRASQTALRHCWAALALVFLGVAGCAHVQPYQREYLADRIMDPAAARRELASERKMLSTREGAAGGALGAGGGCACN